MNNSPDHYGNSWEVGDFIRKQKLNFHRGNAIKYICRAGKKDDEIEDITKSINYLQNELSYLIATGKRVSISVQRPEWGDASEETEIFDR